MSFLFVAAAGSLYQSISLVHFTAILEPVSSKLLCVFYGHQEYYMHFYGHDGR